MKSGYVRWSDIQLILILPSTEKTDWIVKESPSGEIIIEQMK